MTDSLTVTLYGHVGSSPPGGPYFDDLVIGQVFDRAPSMTLTAGIAAAKKQSAEQDDETDNPVVL